MPSFPLYHQAKEDLKNVMVELTDEQEEQRCRDQDIVNALDDYQAPFRERWLRNGALYNLIQTGTDDVLSNWYLGWARILINHSVAMMSEGMPEADFEPVGPSDHKKRILWNALVKHVLNKCNWPAHQRLWLIDNHVFGTGVIKSYAELPMRKRRYQKADGTFEERFMRDFRRAKVGLRQRSPFRCMRSPWIADPDDVPVAVEKETMTWNAFAIKYGNAVNADGTKKYDTDQVPVGSHALLTHLYDENEDKIGTYCVSWGGEPEAKETYSQCPERELGYPIYYKPLSRYKFIDQGRTLVGGANVPGMTPLSFSIFEDQLDGDFETHAVYGMGIPQIIEGPEAIMQGLVNMTVDNVRLQNMVPISFTPNQGSAPSFPDVDVRTMYSGLILDGQFQASPLGVGNVAENQVLWDWLKFIMYQLTGINPDQITGDSLKTAYQSGLLVRQMNMRAKSRISAWERGPLKRSFTNLLADTLSELTVGDWEAITEEEVKTIEERIASDDMTGEDYDDGTRVGDGIKKRKLHFYFPVHGYKFREDFKGKNKTRTLEPNGTDNTLIEDKNMVGDTSYLPATEKTLMPSGRIESVLEFDVHVDGSTMLVDLQVQDMEMMGNVLQKGVELKPYIPEISLKKQYLAYGKRAGFEEDDLFERGTESSETQKSVQDAIDYLVKMKSSNNANVQTPPPTSPAPAPATPGGGPTAHQPGESQPEGPVNDLAAGTV